MTQVAEHAAASLDGLEPGTHLWAFHRDRGQLSRVASTYVGHALAAGDQVLYVTTDIAVDLEDLTFADVGSLARVRAVAASLPESGWVSLRGVPAAIRRTLTLSGLHHERLRLEP